MTRTLISRRLRRAALTLVLGILLAPGAASASYGWPVAPFDRQHPVRGHFGDPRIVGHDEDHGSLHLGVDVSAPDGTLVYAGNTVPPFYDSLLEKLIRQGRDLEEAITRMRVALESFIIEGVTMTAPFLGRVMMHPAFKAGDIDTKFLEREGQLMKETGSCGSTCSSAVTR